VNTRTDLSNITSPHAVR